MKERERAANECPPVHLSVKKPNDITSPSVLRLSERLRLKHEHTQMSRVLWAPQIIISLSSYEVSDNTAVLWTCEVHLWVCTFLVKLLCSWCKALLTDNKKHFVSYVAPYYKQLISYTVRGGQIKIPDVLWSIQYLHHSVSVSGSVNTPGVGLRSVSSRWCLW